MLDINISNASNLSKDTLIKSALFLLTLANAEISHSKRGFFVNYLDTLTEQIPEQIIEPKEEFKVSAEKVEVPGFVGKENLGISDEIDLIDSMGVRWDKNIHSSTKKKNSNGTWRTLRNSKPNKENDIDISSYAPVAPSIPIAPNIEIPTAPVLVETFPNLMSKITAAILEKKLNQAQVTQVALHVGVSSINDLSIRPDLVPKASVIIDSLLAN